MGENSALVFALSFTIQSFFQEINLFDEFSTKSACYFPNKLSVSSDTQVHVVKYLMVYNQLGIF